MRQETRGLDPAAVIRWALVVTLLGCAQQAEAKCRHFSIWKFHYPQSCRVGWTALAAPAKKRDASWYVEVVSAPAASPPPPPQPRSQAEIDRAEHDAAVTEHKDELNRLLHDLQEDEK
jgi:hypothetical protein